MSATDNEPHNRLPATGGANPPASDESDLTGAVEEYLALLEAGQKPERQAFLARYPALGPALAECLEGLEFLHSAVEQLDQPGEGGEEAEAGPTPAALGDFRMIQEIGRGGMGIVYEAEQLSLGRRVALKVLPFAATLDSRHLRRFQNEARAAAQLHHTNIVPVYAVGSERGVHYYAMQFIEGQTLAAIIAQLRRQQPLAEPSVAPADGSEVGPAGQRLHDPDRTVDAEPSPAGALAAAETGSAIMAGLSTERSIRSREFLRTAARLGVQAALALDHAHEQGIVHRDIKPANLLVDGKGNLWITDFGLAQFLTDDRLTLTGDVLGTLRYMSPEQALGKRSLTDHRSDLYSLGVTLYELLTLRPAFAGEDRQDLLRRIGLEDPRPPRRWNRSIPPELETVVLKAMEKNPADRYATARELADDLERFLRDEPIRARRPGPVERARKWSRRHPSVLASTLVALFLAVVALSVSNLLIARANQQKDQALQEKGAALQAAEEAKAAAQQSDAETQAVLRFVESKVFAAARPEGLAGGLGREVTLRRALEAALPSVATSFAGPPLTQARLRRTLGLTFRYLGDEPLAAQQFELAAALYTEHRGPDHPDTLRSLNNLANSHAALGRHADALRLREETLARRQARLGPDDPETLDSMNNLATSYEQLGRHADALPLREQTLELRRANLPPGHQDILASMNNLAVSYLNVGRHAEAARLGEQTLPLMKAQLGPGDPRTLLPMMHNLAQSYHALGRHADALKLYEETLVLAKGKLGPDHRNTQMVRNNLAWLLCTAEDVRFRDPARAVELAAKAAQLSPQNADFAGTLGTARYRAGDWKQASVDLERAIHLRGAADSGNANESFFLAMTRWQLGDKAGARTWFDRGTALMDKATGRQDETRRFRAEAAALLSIEDEPQRPAPTAFR